MERLTLVIAVGLVAACAGRAVSPTVSGMDGSVAGDGGTGDGGGADSGSADAGSQDASVPDAGCEPAPLGKTALDFYVAASGDDANDGSASHPWATLQHAASSLDALPSVTGGATVHVAPGQYAGAVQVNRDGDAGAPVVFVSDVRWGASVDFGGAAYGWEMNGAYQEVHGFDLSNAARIGILYSASHVRVVANRVHDMVSDAAACDSNGGAAIDTGSYAVTDAVLIGNVVFRIGPDGGQPCASGFSVIQGIYFATPDNVAEDNLISNVSADCISSWHGATNLRIANNTVMNCGDVPILIGCGDSACVQHHDSLVVDNIVMHTPSRPGIAEEGVVAKNSYVDNLLFDTLPISLINGTATGTLIVNPNVVDDTGAVDTGDYALEAGSPASATGAPGGAAPANFCGAPWSTSGPNIGAF